MTDTANRPASANPSPARRVLILGATGTIGIATVRELVRRLHEVVCFVREAWAEQMMGRGRVAYFCPWAIRITL